MKRRKMRFTFILNMMNMMNMVVRTTTYHFPAGVMGSNLKSKRDDEPVWLVNSEIGVASWIMKNASYRKETLDPSKFDCALISNYAE
ncbi:hypothetical protein [Photorhabdus laumondii]|uniref:hypothetical protein n=1 Tax=Photorhabdus laumondii TaxID=2218628 RepID=UPI0033159900